MLPARASHFYSHSSPANARAANPASLKSSWLAMLFCWLLVSWFTPTSHADRFDTAHVALPPWMAGKANRIWAKQINDRGTLHRLRVRLGNPKNYEALIQEGINGNYDFLILPQHIGIYLLKDHAYTIIAVGGYDMDIVFITSADELSSIEDIQGKTVGFPDPLAYVSIMAQRLLDKRQYKYSKVFYGHHDTVTRKVLERELPVGVVVEQSLAPLDHSAKLVLKNIYKISSPSFVLALSKSDTPKALQQKMTSTLLSTNQERLKLFPEWQDQQHYSLSKMYEKEKYAVEFLRKHLKATRDSSSSQAATK